MVPQKVPYQAHCQGQSGRAYTKPAVLLSEEGGTVHLGKSRALQFTGQRQGEICSGKLQSLQPNTDLHMQMRTLPKPGGARGIPPHSGPGLRLDCVLSHRVEKPHNSTGIGQRNQMGIGSVVGKNQP